MRDRKAADAGPKGSRCGAERQQMRDRKAAGRKEEPVADSVAAAQTSSGEEDLPSARTGGLGFSACSLWFGEGIKEESHPRRSDGTLPFVCSLREEDYPKSVSRILVSVHFFLEQVFVLCKGAMRAL